MAKPLFGQAPPHPGLQRRPQRRAVEAGRIGVFLHRLALHEQPLAGVDRVERQRLARERVGFRLDAEQRGNERVQMRAECDDQFASSRPVTASGSARAASRR